MLYAWKENSMPTNCLAACTHLSSTVSQLFEPQVQKIAVFTYRSPHFCFPWRRFWGNLAKCCVDGKRIRCLQIVSLHVPITITVSEIERDIYEKNRHFIIPPLHSTPPLVGFPSEYWHLLWDGKTRMVSPPDGEKISKICLGPYLF